MNQIPVKFLKEVANELAYPLAKIIYVSKIIYVFPEWCKTATLKAGMLNNWSQNLQIYFFLQCAKELRNQYIIS